MKQRSRKTWIFISCIIAVVCILSILLPLLIRTFVIQAFKIPSGAMRPTLLVGDHILVNKFSNIRHKLKRGDIIVFIYPKDERIDFVKRIIGLPGDSIEIRNKALYINGILFEEDYVSHGDPQIIPADKNPRDNLGPIILPSNSIFVMGDNRDASFDSRFWGFVEMSKVKGKVARIYWSWDKEGSGVRWERVGKMVH